MFLSLSILFWLGKDCAWNGLIPSMWIIFVLPTLLIACDFVFSSLFSEVSTCGRASTIILLYFHWILWWIIIISKCFRESVCSIKCLTYDFHASCSRTKFVISQLLSSHFVQQLSSLKKRNSNTTPPPTYCRRYWLIMRTISPNYCGCSPTRCGLVGRSSDRSTMSLTHW